MYPSGWPDVVQIDDLKLRYTSDVQLVLRGLYSASSASSTAGWVGVVGAALDGPSQDALIRAVDERRISGVALMVLANRLSEQALGMELTAAAMLAGGVLGSWFQIAAWSAGKGMRIVGMEVHELLAVCYSVQVDQCKEQPDLARLNRKIFGSSHPWGR